MQSSSFSVDECAADKPQKVVIFTSGVCLISSSIELVITVRYISILPFSYYYTKFCNPALQNAAQFSTHII